MNYEDLYNYIMGNPRKIDNIEHPTWYKGNINLFNRPRVSMPDGSTATVRSISFNDDGMDVLIPTISDDGRVMNTKQAVEHYYKTGRHLGTFGTQQEADSYGKMLSEQQRGLINNANI